MKPLSIIPGLLLATLVFACTSDPNPNNSPGNPVGTNLPADKKQDLDRIMKELAATKNMTAQQFGERYKLNLKAQVPYSPDAAINMDLIQNSAMALNSAEITALDQNAFVISDRTSFPSFLYGYSTLYLEDLPVYVTADSILHALHSSYDNILKTIELRALITELKTMLGGMRTELAAGAAAGLGTKAEEDVDLYLAVALSLLEDRVVQPVRGGDAALIQTLVNKAMAEEGMERFPLFGVPRDMDFSQFTPRGHYTDHPDLEKYFRSMMWLGRIDFRLIETRPDHTQVFHRRQLEGSLAIQSLMTPSNTDHWARLDKTIEMFVGESDNMTLSQLNNLLSDLGVSSVADVARISDQDVAQAILDGGYGTQRISSHIMTNGLDSGTMPLSSTFLLLGQRYVVDSHVFSNLVYDRVREGAVKRMMPDPLDAAFAALGNDQAGDLLKNELVQYGYAPDLHMMRYLVDDHGSSFWNANLYNIWLTALRTLSPTDELNNTTAAGLPALAASEAWGRRLLNTQLASWAELRHDTILYAKQSYTSAASCEFPDAYVDPYPAFYAAIANFATHARDVMRNLNLNLQSDFLVSVDDYFITLHEVSTLLQEMAEYQRAGTPFTDTHMAFINEAVRIQAGCGGPMSVEGWFARLYYNPNAGADYDPTIADVHTQPTDEFGTPVGRILHVGTGRPRLMVVTIETCNGVRAYAGLASSYFEKVTENFDRLTDERWSDDELDNTPDVPWMQNLVVR